LACALVDWWGVELVLVFGANLEHGWVQVLEHELALGMAHVLEFEWALKWEQMSADDLVLMWGHGLGHEWVVV
jgi:hypothetical protein